MKFILRCKFIRTLVLAAGLACFSLFAAAGSIVVNNPTGLYNPSVAITSAITSGYASFTGAVSTSVEPAIGDNSSLFPTTNFLTYGSQAAGSAVTAPASAVAYTCASKGLVIVNGGVVTIVSITRAAVVYTTGVLAGVFPCAENDGITITYTTAPTMDFIPE